MQPVVIIKLVQTVYHSQILTSAHNIQLWFKSFNYCEYEIVQNHIPNTETKLKLLYTNLKNIVSLWVSLKEALTNIMFSLSCSNEISLLAVC